MSGFDIDTIKSINKLTKSPIIASGDAATQNTHQVF